MESVALLYMVNNYFRSDISQPVNQLNSNDVEFSIVSYKYPAVIAQNILNLFGAANLSKTLYRRSEKKIKLTDDHFPNDIMQEVYRKNINSLTIANFTKFLIGWSQHIVPNYQSLSTDKTVNF